MNREERRRQARQDRQAITNVGTHHDRNTAVIDTRGAVLLDHVNTVVVHFAAGDAIGLELAGRVNRSTARASALYIFDLEASAKLAADLAGLAMRDGKGAEFLATFEAHLDTQRPETPQA